MAWCKLDLFCLGGVHGVAQVLENTLFPSKYRTSKGIVWFVRVILVFCFCTFAWIFFVSNSLSDAGYVILHLFDGISHPLEYIHSGFSDIGLYKTKFPPIAFYVLVLGVYDYMSLKEDCINKITDMPLLVRYGAYLFLIVLIMCFRATLQAEFVYFQF
jgi:hypothetical protein